MKTTTLNKIREHNPCPRGWKKLLTHLGKTESDDEPLPFSVIVESNGLDDALWCCRSASEVHSIDSLISYAERLYQLNQGRVTDRTYEFDNWCKESDDGAEEKNT